MAAPSLSTSNGGSFEDCHSNVFALTELTGLKWRRFYTPKNPTRALPFSSDPVVKAYGQCMKESIVTTWRRKPSPLPQKPEPLPIPSFWADTPKELWVFWYSNDPPEKLANIIEGLEPDENGIECAATSPISYEVRILYFKALHAIIERDFHRNGFLRFGRWFTRPVSIPLAGQQHMIPGYSIGFNFHFFVHGGNTVCLTVSAQHQPPLIGFARRHLEYKDAKEKLEVILSPWSLRGILLGSDSLPPSESQWKNWEEYCDMEQKAEQSEQDDENKDVLPRMVVVEIDGIRMWYPTSYICVSVEEDLKTQAKLPVIFGSTCSASVDELDTADGKTRNHLLLSEVRSSMHLQSVLQNAHLPPKKAAPTQPPFQPGHGMFQAPLPPQNEEDIKWNMVNPQCPETCTCSLCSFVPPPGFKAGTLEKPVEECNSAPAHPVAVQMYPDQVQMRTNLFFTATKRHLKKRAKHSYHRRFGSTTKASTADGGESSSATSAAQQKDQPASSSTKSTPRELPRPSTPGSGDVSEVDVSDDEVHVPKWASTNVKSAETNIYCSVEDAIRLPHSSYPTQTNSSDDENFACSPFTPIKVLSPCNPNCPCPSASADDIPENLFNSMFQPPKPRSPHGNVPTCSSREERAREYDCYYNPTLREEASFASYHNRRQGERRKPNYPPMPPFPVASSPDQPGSQETIPATTSPPPEFRRMDSDVRMTTNAPPPRKMPSQNDTPRSRRKRPRRSGDENRSWIDLDDEIIEECGTLEEENDDWPRIEEDPEMELGTATLDVRPLCDLVGRTPHHDGFESDEFASGDEKEDDADEPMPEQLTQTFEPMEVEHDHVTDSILSPPASNEFDNPLSAGGYPRCGPSSVGEQLVMNQIYPTPPSVQTELSHPLIVPMLMPTPTKGAVEAMDLEEQTLGGRIADFCDSDLQTAKPNSVKNWINSVALAPVHGTRRKLELSLAGRFASLPSEPQSTVALLRTRRPKAMPADYVKLTEQLQIRVSKPSSTVGQFDDGGGMRSAFQMTPAATAETASTSYKVVFNATPTNVTPVGTPMGAPPMHPHMNMGMGTSYTAQIRTTPMISARPPGSYPYSSTNPYVPQQPMGPPGYGHTPGGGYGGGGQYGAGGMNQYGAPGGMFPGPGGQMGHMGQMGMGGMGHQMGPMSGQMPMYPGGPMTMNQGMMMGGQTANHYQSPHQPMMPPPTGPFSMDSAPMPPPMSSNHGYHGMNSIPGPPAYNSLGGMGHQMRPSVPMGGQQMPMMQPSTSFGNAGPLAAVPVQPPPQREQFTEGHSITLALILSDTVLDLHYDTVFDACPICSCNSTIRSRELGLYLNPPDDLKAPPHEQIQKITQWSGFNLENSNTCVCGFSAVRHRYLSMYSGLFPEDSREAIAFRETVATLTGLPPCTNAQGQPVTSSVVWFANSQYDMQLIDLIRNLTHSHFAGRSVDLVSANVEQMNRALTPDNVAYQVSSNAEYILSSVDSIELMLIGNSAVEFSIAHGGLRTQGVNSKLQGHPKFLQIFHQWGLQFANEIRSLKEAEWRTVLSEVAPVLERSVKIVRCAPQTASIVEGPLTWKSLTVKSLKSATTQEEDSYLPEPVPFIVVATEKEAIRITPQALCHWDHLSLGPVDQPKDVFYMAVVPENPMIAESTVKYMEQLSGLYERMRLGRHIACHRAAPDGLIRVGGTVKPQMRSGFDFIKLIEKTVDHPNFIRRLRVFTQQMEDYVFAVFKEHKNLHDRYTFREALAKDQKAKKAQLGEMAQAAEKNINEREGITSSASAAATPATPRSASAAGHEAPSTCGPDGNTGFLVPKIEPSTMGTLQDLLSDGPSTSSTSNANAAAPTAGSTTSPATASTSATTTDPNATQVAEEDIPVDEYGTMPHVIVIYVVNPFVYGSEYSSPLLMRVATLAILRSFNEICSRLKTPEFDVHLRTQLQLEIIGLDQINDIVVSVPCLANDARPPMQLFSMTGNEQTMWHMPSSLEALREMALSIYTHPRILMPDCIKSIQSRVMTRFGPGTQLMDTVEELMRRAQPVLYKIPSNAFYLAPQPILSQKLDNTVVTISPDEQVLYLTYCLIGSDWLCATVTDAQGRLNDNCLINLRPKDFRADRNYKYRARTQILEAMGRLWQYVMGVLAMDLKNWRLVIGRLGRIGHGEFRAWTHLLNKTALRRHSAKLKELCPACAQVAGYAGQPAILSACLVSLEPEPYVRVIPGCVTVPPQPENPTNPKMKQVRQLSTPEDISVTHIMTFPAGADIQFGSNDHQVGNDEDFDDFLGNIDLTLDDGENQALIECMADEDPSKMGGDRSASFRMAGGNNFFPENSDASMENQPLSTGFYVSTAPPGDLPDWFWSTSPGAKRNTPVHLKSSLHINVTEVQKEDDISGQGEKHEKSSHPLDSGRTDEVLRHVLETYNALSWLSMDPVSGDRRSCLPIHIQALLRLYHSVSRLIM